MRTLVALTALALAGTVAHAQVSKCITPSGKVEYRQGACDGAAQAAPITRGTTSGVDAISRRDLEHARALEARDRAEAAANMAAQQAQAQRAAARPSGQDIHNLEVSAGSVTRGKKERDFLQAEARRARAAAAGDGEYSHEDLSRIKRAQDDQNKLNAQERQRARGDAEAIHMRSGGPATQAGIVLDRQREDARANARRAAAGSVMTSCDAGGCWDSTGRRYNRAAGTGNFVRQDGRTCITVADRLQCN